MALAIGVLFAVIGLFFSSVSAVNWVTYREDISIASGFTDIAYNETIGYSGEDTKTIGEQGAYTHNETHNYTLPISIDNLTTMTFLVYNNFPTDGQPIWFNLSINGVNLDFATEVNESEWGNATKADYEAAGGDIYNTTWINYSFNATYMDDSEEVVKKSCDLYLILETTDAQLNSTWLTNVLSHSEYDMTNPTVGYSKPSTYWNVNDTCNVSMNIWFTNATVAMHNATFNITYPSHTVGTPTTTQFNFTTIESNQSAQKYVQYQKYGPYVYSVDEEIDGKDHEVTIKLSSDELLTNCVYWTIDPDNEEYDGVFDTLNFNNLDIELNNVNQDWDQDGDSIELEDFTAFASIAGNKWVFTWTEAAVTPPPTGANIWDNIVDWMLANTMGIPNILLTLAIIAIVMLIGIVAYQRKD